MDFVLNENVYKIFDDEKSFFFFKNIIFGYNYKIEQLMIKISIKLKKYIWCVEIQFLFFVKW